MLLLSSYVWVLDRPSPVREVRLERGARSPYVPLLRGYSLVREVTSTQRGNSEGQL